MQASPTVTAAEIARLAGVGRAAVSNWRRRHADFPTPVAGTATSPEFDLADVRSWLRAQGKLADLSLADLLWRELTAATDNAGEVVAAIGEFLIDRHESRPGAPVKPKRGSPLTAPVGPTRDGPLTAHAHRQITALADDEGDEATFDEFLRYLTDAPTKRGRQIPDELADVMVALADVADGTVLDPACGVGGVLRAAARAGCRTAWGQEIDPTPARITAAWLGLHKIAGEVRVGDSLRADAFAGELLDAVVTCPPFGVTTWGQEELSYDPRWEYGTPPRTEPELAWTQHALAHLRPGGTAVLLMPPAAASRRAGRRIRAELLRRGALRAVIGLPARAAPHSSVPLHLWVLRRPMPDQAPPPNMWVADVGAGLTGEPIDAYASIVHTLRSDGRESPAEGPMRSVSVIELLDEDVDVSPVRRRPPASVTQSRARLLDARTRLAGLLAELPDLVPQVVGDPHAPPTASPTVSLAELVKAGAVTVLGPVRAVNEPRATEPRTNEPRAGEPQTTEPRPDSPPVLTVHDVLHDRPASGEPADLTPEIIVAPDDVIVPVMARQLTTRVVTDGGAALGSNLYVLRTNPKVLDPWFLAGQLRACAHDLSAGSLSGLLRFDIRRVQVGRLGLAEQRRVGAAFRRVDAFDRAMRSATAAGADVVRLAIDGLARGAVDPGPIDSNVIDPNATEDVPTKPATRRRGV